MSKDARLARMAHVLIHMQGNVGSVSSDVIARMLDTNPVLVRRMMGDLRNAGIVRSELGPRGGWHLVRKLDEITLLDVHNAFETATIFSIGLPNRITECRVEGAADGAVRRALSAADGAFRESLASCTLAQILSASGVA